MEKAISDAAPLRRKVEEVQHALNEIERKTYSKYQTNRTDVHDLFERLRQALNAKEASMLQKLDDQYKEESLEIFKRLDQTKDLVENIERQMEVANNLLRMPLANTTLADSYEDVISSLSTFTDEYLSTMNYTPFEIYLEADEGLLEQFQMLNIVIQRNDAG